MGIDVSAKLVIAQSRKEVARYAMEPTNDPKWTKGITEAELLTERPIGMGTQVRRIAKFLGKEIHYVPRDDPNQWMVFCKLVTA